MINIYSHILALKMYCVNATVIMKTDDAGGLTTDPASAVKVKNLLKKLFNIALQTILLLNKNDSRLSNVEAKACDIE